jgi:hypothetical protein
MNHTDNNGRERTDVAFHSGGVDCAAWLYTPEGNEPFATVVMGHRVQDWEAAIRRSGSSALRRTSCPRR